jgi:hypothetical protein
MMKDFTYAEAIRATHDADVDPLDVGRLPGWGYSCRWWDDEEIERMQAPDGSPFRGIVWGGLIALGLWCAILSGLYWLMKVGMWR